MQVLGKTAAPLNGALTDLEVVHRVKDGDKALFEILMRRHNQTLYRAVRSYLKDGSDVEDAMQEAYLKAYAKLDQFKGEAAFSTWLVRIGVNEALQHLRRERHMQRLADADVHAERLDQLPDGGMNPEQRSMQEQNHRLLEAAIDKLPEAYRSVYMLREVEDMGVADVAESLGLSEGNVKVRLHRAKAMLKESLMSVETATPAFEFGNKHCDRLVAWVMARI